MTPGCMSTSATSWRSAASRSSCTTSTPTLDQVLPLGLSSAAVGLTTAGAAVPRPDAGVAYVLFLDPSPYADHVLVWRRDTGNATVVAFVRRLRVAGAFMPATS